MNKDFLGWLFIVAVMAFYFVVGKILLLRVHVVYFSLFTVVIAIVLTVYMFASHNKNEKEKTSEDEDIKIE